ncbi:MAG: nucleotidyltransferase family protein [Myxococcaceae bacterium]|nr:nucleotidyltransferase family protein [Myxococcaceae bacterium]
MLTLLELFRLLSSFTPKRQSLAKAPWDEYVEWAVPQGLAPLAAYNLEYRFAGGGAPERARDRLLGIYQGLMNDNVMKLVNFKRSVDSLEGRRVVLLGSASFAEELYPHIAFRPVAEIRLLMPPGDVQPMAGFLKNAEFKPAPAAPDEGLAPDLVVSDDRTAILLHGKLTGDAKLDAALLERARPAKVYGPSMHRLPHEDALLVQVLFAARAGFDVPFIEWVDVRELAFNIADAGLVKVRAAEWGVERALYAALQVVTRLFPDVTEAAAKLTPDLSLPVRKLLDVGVVDPVAVVGKKSTARPAEALRAMLTAS